MSNHSEGVQKGKFCALRTGSDQKCEHPDGSPGNQYRNNCKPKGWSDDFFYQGSKKAVEKSYEAHHQLCVASVTQYLANKRKLLDIIKQTKWCINAKTNMYAMPLWGHTIQYYCDIETRGLSVDERFKIRIKGPPFKNIPQHDYDHNSTGGYKDDVDKKIKELAEQIDKKKDKHEEAVKDLKKKLNVLSKYFRDELNRRGSKRCDGTHEAWRNARKDEAPNWYEPFSMADDGKETPRAFPLCATSTDEWVANKIKSLVKAFGKWG